MDASVFKSLLKVQFASIGISLMGGGEGKKSKKILFALLFLYLAAVMLLYFGLLCYSICTVYCESGLKWFYFAFTGIFALILSFLGSVFTTQTQIYKAKDNDLLFSMPIRPSYILSSRMISVGVVNYAYAMTMLIPAGVVYCMNYTPSVAGVIIYIICALTLPLLSQALSGGAAWILQMVSNKLKHKAIATMVLYVAVLGAYFAFIFKVNDYLTFLVNQGETMANAVKKAFFPAYFYGIAIAEHNVFAMIISVLCGIVPMAFVIFLLSRNLGRIINSGKTAEKKKYTGKKLEVSSPFFALLKKELARFFSSPAYIMNGSAGTLMCVIMVGAFLLEFEDMAEVFSVLGLKNNDIALFAAVALASCAGMNSVSASSISLEARTLWILKAIPVDIKDVLMAKVGAHLVVSAPPVVISSVLCAVFLMPDVGVLTLLFILPLVVTAMIALLGIVLNINLPRFNWNNEMQAVKQGLSVFICLMAGIAAVAVPMALYFLLFSAKIDILVYTYVVTAFYGAVNAGLYYYTVKIGVEKFKAL